MKQPATATTDSTPVFRNIVSHLRKPHFYILSLDITLSRFSGDDDALRGLGDAAAARETRAAGGDEAAAGRQGESAGRPEEHGATAAGVAAAGVGDRREHAQGDHEGEKQYFVRIV